MEKCPVGMGNEMELLIRLEKVLKCSKLIIDWAPLQTKLN